MSRAMRLAVGALLVACQHPVPPCSDGGAISAPCGDCADLAPERIDLRDAQQSFNQRYEVWLCEGFVYLRTRPTETEPPGPWGRLTLPYELDGRAVSLGMDDTYLEVADDEGAIWLTWKALDDVERFSWVRHRGLPFGMGRRNFLPEGALAWTVSATTPDADAHYTDPSGWLRDVGTANCTHLFALKEGGQFIGFNDGWLPADWNHEMCSPERGRFLAVALASSGSRHLVINAYGDLFTRVYDFDLSGANNAFSDYQDYTYADQSGIEDDAERVFQLPPWPWFEQPKIPGRITDRISLHKVGPGVLHALMRVEGWDAEGHSGFWEKDMHDVVEDPADPGPWVFVRTDLPIHGTELDNDPEDRSHDTLGPDEEACFGRNLDQVGALPDAPDRRLRDEDWAAEVVGLHPTCSPAVLRIHVGSDAGATYDLVLHTTETFRAERLEGRGLTDVPRPRQGAIEVPLNLYEEPEALHPVMQALLDDALDGERFTFADVEVSAERLIIHAGSQRWILDARGCHSDPHLSLRRPTDPINGGYGFVFEDLYLDDRAAQIHGGEPSERNIHDLGDLHAKGW